MYQIIYLDADTGKWQFVAHGARYDKASADEYVNSAAARGVTCRLLHCKKPRK